MVSARKYRPETFTSIVGQGAMSSTLRTAVQKGRMAHAYLFCGPRGVGKTTAARVLAKTINCFNLSSDGEACNECESCKAFNEGRSFNIFELDAASNNSVEDIRSLIEQVAIAPVLGKYKVYIIDEVHMLSQAAFNAFLKTLEEPPSYAIFILATTEKHKILPTILSRCQTYDFKRITVMDIAGHLRYVANSEGIQAEDAALGLIAEKADGGMRDALSMFDRVASYGQGAITYYQTLECLNILDYSYYVRFIQGFVGGDYRGVLLTLNEVLSKGFDAQLVMSGLSAFARDLLVVQHAETISLLEKPETAQQLYLETARLVAPSALHQIIRMLVEADGKYRTASDKRLLVEVTLLNILSSFQPNALERSATQPTAQIAPRVVDTVVPTQVSVQAVAASQSAREVEHIVASQSPESSVPTVEVKQIEKTPVTLKPSQQEQIRQTRRQFRQRNRVVNSVVDEETPLAESHNPYTERDMQEAYMRYVEGRIATEQVILKSTLPNTMPRLVDSDKVEIALPNSSAIVEPVQTILPKLQRYIQSELGNTDVQIEVRLLEVEQTYIPVTNKEKYAALKESYPILEQFREHLQLRIV